ncbi:MAG: DNA internalization-related competence protein ComEC/Rec2 [Candidatus Krumholzibacteriota bacterium]
MELQVFPLAARGAALLPAVFAMVTGWGVVPVWLGVLAGGYAAGSMEAIQRQSRHTAVAERPYSVAQSLVWHGPAIVRITGWPAKAANDRWRAPARILHLGDPVDRKGDLDPRPGQGVMLSGKGTAPEPGARLTGPLEFSVPSGASVPGAFDYRLFLAGRGLAWRGRLTDWRILSDPDLVATLGSDYLGPLRRGIVARISRLLPPGEARMAGAVLLGIRDSESRRASRSFSDLGLAHLFAVSGLHVGILLGIIVLPGQWSGLSPGLRLVPIMVFLPVYVLLTGLPGSVMRAASLGFLALLAAGVGRPANALRLIGLLFWAGTIWDPVQNLDTGLKLSYFAAGGILGVSALSNGLRFSTNRFLGPLFTGLAVSAAAQWFTLPLVAGSFGRISSLSLLANLVAVPLFGLAVWCVVLSLLAASVWAGGAEILGALSWFLFRTLGGMAGYVSRGTAGFPVGLPPPDVALLVLWILLSAVGLFTLNLHLNNKLRGSLTLGICLLMLTAGVMSFGPLSWKLGAKDKVTAWQFDVGQGDCGLIIFPDGWSLMIDTAGLFGFGRAAADGPLTRSIMPFLQRNGLAEIDAVVLTHGHRDHTGGARSLNQAVRVGAWFVSGKAGHSLTGQVDSTRIVFPRTGQVLHRWREWDIRVAYPPGPLGDDIYENDHSLVVVLRRSGRDLAVWSGDLELEGEHHMLAGGQAPADVQVWKAGHHGSDTSGSPALLDLLDPELVLISCGVGNSYKHPSHGAYVVAGDTVAIARTDLQGTIRLEWDLGGTLTWRTMATEPRKIGLP